MLVYNINVLKELKKKGYSALYLREHRLLSESVIQSLRENKIVSVKSLDVLCGLLDCQIGDIIKYVN